MWVARVYGKYPNENGYEGINIIVVEGGNNWKERILKIYPEIFQKHSYTYALEKDIKTGDGLRSMWEILFTCEANSGNDYICFEDRR